MSKFSPGVWSQAQGYLKGSQVRERICASGQRNLDRDYDEGLMGTLVLKPSLHTLGTTAVGVRCLVDFGINSEVERDQMDKFRAWFDLLEAELGEVLVITVVYEESADEYFTIEEAEALGAHAAAQERKVAILMSGAEDGNVPDGETLRDAVRHAATHPAGTDGTGM